MNSDTFYNEIRSLIIVLGWEISDGRIAPWRRDLLIAERAEWLALIAG